MFSSYSGPKSPSLSQYSEPGGDSALSCNLSESLFYFALFTLLMSLLVKSLHSHPLYSLCSLCYFATFIHSAQRHHAHTGGRGGITQGVSFEFFESFLLIYSHNIHWVNFEFFQKLLTTLIKTYSQGNFRNWSKKALHLAQKVILSNNPKVLSWICSKFAHNVPKHLLNGFFESLLKNWTKLRVSLSKLKKNSGQFVIKFWSNLWKNLRVLSGPLYPSALNVLEDSSRSNQSHWSLHRLILDC